MLEEQKNGGSGVPEAVYSRGFPSFTLSLQHGSNHRMGNMTDWLSLIRPSTSGIISSISIGPPPVRAAGK